ncbi:MAG: hypothetical protein ACK4RF_13030, partial [Cyclobacteriaceae bacterium]
MSRPILYLIFTLLFSSTASIGLSQSPAVDSMLLLLPSKKNEDRVNLLNEMATIIRESSQKEAIGYSLEADSL